MLHKMDNMVMNNSAYKQIHLYSIPPSNISTIVDTICIFLHVNVNVIVSFHNSVTQVNANVSSSIGNGVSKLLQGNSLPLKTNILNKSLSS